MPNLQEFISNVKNNGLQKQNRFEVNIYRGSLSSGVGVKDTDSGRFISLLSDNVSVPGMNFSSNPVFTFGEPREVVYNRNFDPATLTVYGDAQMKSREYFDEWQSSVMNPVTRTVSYYADYIRQVEIRHLDLEGNTRYRLTLHEAYPKAISPYELGNDNNTILRISVQLQFKFYTYTSDPIIAKQGNPRDKLSNISRESPQ
jgi:hypothetical protein